MNTEIINRSIHHNGYARRVRITINPRDCTYDIAVRFLHPMNNDGGCGGFQITLNEIDYLVWAYDEDSAIAAAVHVQNYLYF